MPKKRIITFEAWSFSRLSDYEKCAFMAYCKYLDPKKPKFVPNQAMQRGTDIHKAAEDYVAARIRKMPESLQRFEDEFKDLRKIRRMVQLEGQLAINDKWEQTEWFGNDTWCRVKMDVVHPKPKSKDRLVMIDHKTGKIRPAHEDQLDLYAAVGFAVNPHNKHIESALWYLDWGEIVAKNYTQKEFPGLKKLWIKRTKKMLTDKKFTPTPGNHCTWCDFSKSKGGPCKY